MTDNMSKFLESGSQDKELIEKLNKAETPETVIALAAEKGFTLTPEDLKKPEPAYGQISDDDLNDVVGGDKCVCVFGGYGAEAGSDCICVCPLGGGGGASSRDDARCVCVVGGNGIETNT